MIPSFSHCPTLKTDINCLVKAYKLDVELRNLITHIDRKDRFLYFHLTTFMFGMKKKILTFIKNLEYILRSKNLKTNSSILVNITMLWLVGYTTSYSA